MTAVLPYFPYVRSDKKDQPRIAITARLMADLLQTAGADRILTMNLHSPQVQGFFRVPVDQLQDTSDLYNAGLTSLATVGLMLALEEQFNIEFPDNMLSRKTFASIEFIVDAVQKLVDK